MIFQEEEIERLEKEVEELRNCLDKTIALGKQQEQYFEKEKKNLKQHMKDLEH